MEPTYPWRNVFVHGFREIWIEAPFMKSMLVATGCVHVRFVDARYSTTAGAGCCLEFLYARRSVAAIDSTNNVPTSKQFNDHRCTAQCSWWRTTTNGFELSSLRCGLVFSCLFATAPHASAQHYTTEEILFSFDFFFLSAPRQARGWIASLDQFKAGVYL